MSKLTYRTITVQLENFELPDAGDAYPAAARSSSPTSRFSAARGCTCAFVMGLGILFPASQDSRVDGIDARGSSRTTKMRSFRSTSIRNFLRDMSHRAMPFLGADQLLLDRGSVAVGTAR